MPDSLTIPPSNALDHEIIIIGAGLSGLASYIELSNAQHDDILILEKNNTLGGLWQTTNYPGASCDIPSFNYCYAFELSPHWTSLFSTSQSVQNYLEFCAKKYAVKKSIRFNSTVICARFNPKARIWILELSDGSVLRCRYLIAATGLNHDVTLPEISGLDSFSGTLISPYQWPKDLELNGKRVALIGTGQTAIQLAPKIATKLKQLVIFQRTANWVLPKYDLPLPRWLRWCYKYIPLLYRSVRASLSLTLNLFSWVFLFFRSWPWSIKGIEAFLRIYLRLSVRDKTNYEKLLPKQRLGVKRLLFSHRYLSLFNAAHVDLETSDILSINGNTLTTVSGQQYEVDCLILATGFTPRAGYQFLNFPLIDRHNKNVMDNWLDNGFQAYQGISIPDCPNFFLLPSPYSTEQNQCSLVNSQLILIKRILAKMRKKQFNYVEITPKANARYYHAIRKHAKNTVYQDKSAQTINNEQLDCHNNSSLLSPISPFKRRRQAKYSSLSAYEFR